VFLKEFTEPGDAAFFVLAEMKMDVPLKVIAPEILIELGAGLDNVVEHFEAKLPGLLEFAAEFAIFNAAP
jgi:hypothetical protein